MASDSIISVGKCLFHHVWGKNQKDTLKVEVRDLTNEEAASFIGSVPSYHYHPIVRTVIISAVVFTALALIIIFREQIVSALSSQAGWIQTAYAGFMANKEIIALSVGAFFAITIPGAAIVIRKILNTKDEITGEKIGALTGDKHWVGVLCGSKEIKVDKAQFEVEDGRTDARQTALRAPRLAPAFMDTSTLVNGTGKAYIYYPKSCFDHHVVILEILVTTPTLRMVGEMAYYSARAILLPFYILGCMAIESAFLKEGESLFGDRRFEWSDITNQTYLSIERVVKAPFYATALMGASLYALMDPNNGRKLGSWVERRWNDGLSRAQGFWSVRGPQSLWKLEGGGSPEQLGENGFYSAGCWQPMGVAEFKNGALISAHSLSREVTQGDDAEPKGEEYVLYTQASLERMAGEKVT